MFATPEKNKHGKRTSEYNCNQTPPSFFSDKEKAQNVSPRRDQKRTYTDVFGGVYLIEDPNLGSNVSQEGEGDLGSQLSRMSPLVLD